jgi:hypothetical protein
MLSFISDQQSMASSVSQLRLRRALIVLLAIFIVFYFLWPSRASPVVANSAGVGAGGPSGGVPRPQNAQRPQQAWTEQELREWDNLDVIKNETLGVWIFSQHIPNDLLNKRNVGGKDICYQSAQQA